MSLITAIEKESERGTHSRVYVDYQCDHNMGWLELGWRRGPHTGDQFRDLED